MKNSFFRWVIDKRGLKDQIITFTFNQEQHQMEMRELIQIVDKKTGLEKHFINQTIKDMEILNRDLMEFVVFLAKNHFMELSFGKEKTNTIKAVK